MRGKGEGSISWRERKWQKVTGAARRAVVIGRVKMLNAV
jgi:hypothetical protein